MNLWKKRYGQVRFRSVDIACMSYFAVTGFLLLFFHKNIPNWLFYVALHTGIVFGILEVVRLGESSREIKARWFIRLFYPIVINVLAWRELDDLIPMFFDNYWATDVVIEAEKSVFGGMPNVWVQQFYQPWLDELMHVFYSAYYLFVPLVTLILYFKKKYDAVLAAFFIGIFTHLINFSLFFFLPVLAPFMAERLRDYDIGSWTGYWIADFTRLAQSTGACRGATFPSSHVSAAFVWSFIALRYLRPLGYTLLPLALGIAASTVYLGYHYALDPFFGLILALFCYPIALKILKSRNEDPSTLA